MTTNNDQPGRHQLEPRLELTGAVDFTMMYAAHDAFSRDLELLVSSCTGGNAGRAVDRARWETFTTQLHVHHHAEDDALWPPLRNATLDRSEVAALEAMELEHAAIEPHLVDVDKAISAEDSAAIADALLRLRNGLAEHMRHEENAALPMIEKHLGPPGWKAFTATFRETQGIRGAATYFPWLLEGASAQTQAKVLGVLPPPARLLYRTVWAPRYRRATKPAAR
jgi:hemerythrin-like domain-containing protein